MLDLQRVNLNCDFSANDAAIMVKGLGLMTEQNRARVLGGIGQAEEISDFAGLNAALAIEAYAALLQLI